MGALKNLGHQLSHQTVGNILRRHSLSCSKRKQAISWKDFIRSHREVLVGTDFFTVEVLWLANCDGRADFTGNRAAKVN